MEGRYNFRPRASGRVQACNTTQYYRPQQQQYFPPAGVPPSSDVHSLRQALLSAEEDNLKWSSENASLKNQVASLQRTLGRKLHMAKQNINGLEKALEATKSGNDDHKKRQNSPQISALQESLKAQKEETERVREFWMKESDTIKATFQAELKKIKSACDSQRSTELQQMEADCQRKVSQLQEQIIEQDKVITSIKDDLKACKEEHFIVSSQLSLKQTELDQSTKKCDDLEENFKKELAEQAKESDKMKANYETELKTVKTQISALEESLKEQEEKTERVREFWMKESDTMKATFDAELKKIKSACDSQRSTELQQMEADCQRKVSQLQEQITEQDKVITSIKDDLKARTEEHFIVSSQLSLKQTELDQRAKKCDDLADKFMRELAEREENWQRRQKEMEKLWQEKEEALIRKTSKAEEELKLVIIKNIHLQELALKNMKKKRGFWRKRTQKSSVVEEPEAAGCSAQDGEEGKKKEKKEKKLRFWSKKKQRRSSEEEDAVCSVEAGQDKEGKEEKQRRRGFWSWTRERKSSHSDTDVVEAVVQL